jgi:hypothetical protein
MFAEEPRLPKPEEARLTPTPFDEPKFAAVAEWMAATDCIVGLGDGSGLAYVTNDAAVAGWIASLEVRDQE